MRSSTSTVIYIIFILSITVLGLPANSPPTLGNATSLESSVNAVVICWDVGTDHGPINERLCENTFKFLLSSPGAAYVHFYAAARRVFGVGNCGIVLDYAWGTYPVIGLSLVDVVIQSQRILGNCARQGAGGSMQFEQEPRYYLSVGHNLVARPRPAGSARNPNVGTA